MTLEQEVWIVAYWIKKTHGVAALAHVTEQSSASLLAGDSRSALKWERVADCLEELEGAALAN